MSTGNSLITCNVFMSAPGVTVAGFETPMLISHGAPWGAYAPRMKTYANLTEVGADYATTDPEYLWAQAVFAQSPCPSEIKIGRAVGVPTKIVEVRVVNVVNSQAYQINVFYAGAVHLAQYTSDGSATNDEIVEGLRDALNLLAAKNFTATATGAGGSEVLTITGNAAGDWFAVEPLNADTPTALTNNLKCVETTANTSPTIQADLAEIALEDNDFYCPDVLFKSSAILQAVATWCEANNKLFAPSTSDTEGATVADSIATDVLKTLKSASRARTGMFFHPRDYEFASAAQLGAMLPVDPGKDDWVNRTLSGVTPVAYTTTQITNLKAKYANFYAVLAGVNVTQGNGKVSSGLYIDVIRDLDQMAAWYVEDFTQLKLDVAARGQKIPFTDEGIDMVRAVLSAVNARGITAGIVAKDPAPTITIPALADISAADKLARELNDIVIAFTLAGSIHSVEVNVYASF